MEYRQLGKSDLHVSVLSLGTWQFADQTYWGKSEQADADAAVRAAIDAGINLFDTAESYANGESEQALGRALRDQHGKVYVATKVLPENCARGKLRASCEASLQRLGVDRIDLYQVHWPSRDHPFDETYEELDKLRQEGKIRAIGLSNFGSRDLDAWLARGDALSNQVGYNLVFRAIEYHIMPACLKRQLGILAYMPLMQGLLAGTWNSVEDIPATRRRTRHFSSSREGVRHGEPGCERLLFQALEEIRSVAEELGESMANVALAWIMAQPGVTSVVVGGRKPDQIRRNIGAADLDLPPEIVARLDTITEPMKEHFGGNSDMWMSQSESRIR
jgi:myo-inositol catabolism protein IolS